MKPAFAVWLTGLPASGKTTLAHELRRKLSAHGIQSVIIDSDEMRKILTPAPTFSREERDWFYGAIAQLAKWLADGGVNVLIAATANRRAYRDAARKQIERFAEVYVRCSIDECRRRDPKGLYAKAAAGKINYVPGAGSDFEEPLNAELIVDSDRIATDEAADAVLKKLDEMGFLTQ
ncbi:MAG TPA: adenylyl-sulfate kinase [Planctomycetota bacterium]|nr:adenylyl-sulfate kinase [Planctomycetota bacterium]